MNKYSIVLGNTYYASGYFNPGVAASSHLGNNNESLIIKLKNQGEINTIINRTINTNCSVRVYGGNDLIEFIKNNYNLNEKLHFEIINPNTIVIR